jgi:DNA-binding NarL/FixJ family response regulator
MEKDIRVIIADDHTLFRDGLVALLNSVPEIDVVGTAQDGEEAIQLAAEVQPDVVLMDLLMPKVNGIEATKLIIQTSPHIGVVMLTMFEDDESVFAAMRAGARGYILKGADLTPPASEPVQAFPELTDREHEILALIAEGQSNSEIAEQLHISLKTVRNHVSNIYNKMQVTDRVQAVLRAREAGLGVNNMDDQSQT